MLIADPVTVVTNLGPSLGAVITCTGLFIWSQIQFTTFGRDLRHHMESDDRNFNDLKTLQAGGMNQQNQVSMSIVKMAEAVRENGEAIARIADNQTEQLALLKDMVADNRVLISNQENVQVNQLKLLELLVGKLTN